jgi:di/tricarboxylate transporter
MWSFCAAVVDLVITISLVLVLKSKIMGFSDRTDGVLKKLIQLTISTAVPTTIVAIVGAALAFAFGDDSHASNSPTAFWRQSRILGAEHSL